MRPMIPCPYCGNEIFLPWFEGGRCCKCSNRLPERKLPPGILEPSSVNKLWNPGEEICVHRSGTPCFVGADKIPATILSAKIGQGNSIVYEVGWFNAGTYCDVWLLPCEFTTEQPPKQPIGFIDHAQH